MGGGDIDGVAFDAHAIALLDMLKERIGQLDALASVKLLCTVLENTTKEDPKYRQLKARNDKLWVALLQHPELCGLLKVAGFEKQRGMEGQSETERIHAQ